MSTPQDLKDTVKDLSNATIQGHFYPMDIIQRHIELEEGLQERALQDYLQAANTLREDLEICANIDEAVRAEMLHNVDFLKAAIVRKGNIYSKRQHDVLNGLRSQQEQVGASLRQLDVEKDDLATRKASLAEEKAAFEGEEAELKNQQDELKKYDNLVAVLSSDFVHVKDVQGIKKQHGSELQALRDEHEEQIQQLNRQHSKDINNVEVRCRAENEAVNRHQAAKLQYAEFLSLFALEDLKEAQGYNLHLIKAVLNRTGCLPLVCFLGGRMVVGRP